MSKIDHKLHKYLNQTLRQKHILKLCSILPKEQAMDLIDFELKKDQSQSNSDKI